MHVSVITPEQLLRHWQGHRALTRHVIDRFPEEALFRFSVGGMRPFAELAGEMIRLAHAGIRGMVNGDWDVADTEHERKVDLLAAWDRTTETIDTSWPRLAPDWPTRKYVAFGQWEGTGWSHVFYWIDNEVHHRGQGYVYLRALGVEPPPFWVRE